MDPRRAWGSVPTTAGYPRTDAYRGVLSPLQYSKMGSMEHGPTLHATPERKSERTATDSEREEGAASGAYDTPEKLEALSLRVLSPKVPTPRERRTDRAIAKRTPKPPKAAGLDLPLRQESEARKADILQPLAELNREKIATPCRNPFRHESDDGTENRSDNLWDVSVLMPPLSLDALPSVDNIAPALRNALRFLTFNSCPDVDVSDLPPVLGPRDPSKRLTVVLDLDETLMHCQKKGIPEGQPDLCLHFTDSSTTGYVRFRPHAYYFIKTLASWDACEVVVFTASTQAYADAVLNVLDEKGSLVDQRLYRPHCVHAHGGYFKDLRTLGRPMSSTVLVDNSPVSLATNPANGIPIKSWTSQNDDRELMDLLPFLYDLMTCGRPVSPILEERYRLRSFLEDLRSA